MEPETIYNRGFSSFSTIIVFIALMLIGVSVIPLLDIKLEPTRSLPTVTVSFSWPDASARVVEEQVTSLLEGAFATLDGVRSISSYSARGSGTVTVNFKKETNMDAARFAMATQIRRIYPSLPEEVSYPYLSLSAGGRAVQPILTYNLNAAASPYYIQKYAEEHLVPQLSTIPGVADIRVSGATPFEWEITFRMDRLAALGLTADDLAGAVNRYFRKDILGMGVIAPGSGHTEKSVRLVLQNDIPPEVSWSRIPVKRSGDRIIYLGDVAEVRYREQSPSAYYRINGLNTVNMVFYPVEQANNIRVARSVRERMREIRRELPPGYSVLLSYDETEYVAAEIHKVVLRTLFSMLILLIFVLLISRQVKYLLLIFISLVANLVIAAAFYYLLKMEIHLYSLAGITVSFGIIIDNSIVMIDHLRHQHNKKVFMAILAATLTTIGALSVIFFLTEKQKINLVDFAGVIIINLTVSLVIALFFIPALMDKIRLQERRNRHYYRSRRRVVRFTRAYGRWITVMSRYRWVFIVALVLSFGLPLYMLPEKIKKDTRWARLYNKTLGSSLYREKIRPVTDKALGGTLRLFTQNVFESSFYSTPSRTVLYVNASMPEGSTIEQMNEAIRKMENFISGFDEVEMFKTYIGSYRNGRITIYFKPEVENGSFPYYLKGALISKAINVGGLDWGIYGVGRGFSNALYSGWKNSRIILEGYNYDRLYAYAEQLRKDLLRMARIKEVDILGGTSTYNTRILHEFYIRFNREQLALDSVSLVQFYSYLRDRTYRRSLGRYYLGDEAERVVLVSDRAGRFNVWDLKNEPVVIGKRTFKTGMLASIRKRKTGNEIYKYNQQYQLTVAYDYIGSGTMAARVEKEKIKEMNNLLPLGFRARSPSYSYWDRKSKKQYYLIFLVIVIIYFICSILLESLLQPLAIISLIPLAYVGVFLTFYLFDLNFDQGGFASFILLAGIVVNSGLYIINDFNNFARERGGGKDLRLYLKAYNHKIIPVFLTVISTILGLLPFIWGGQHEVFWFAFAAGAMGGLLFSVLAVIVWLPLLVKIK